MNPNAVWESPATMLQGEFEVQKVYLSANSILLSRDSTLLRYQDNVMSSHSKIISFFKLGL